MSNTNFQKAEKIYFTDKIIKLLFLWMFPKWICPNHVTVFRFIATPFVVVLMLCDHYLIGLISFLVVASSDMIDGALARTRNQITDWGKVYDPLADKILIGSMVFVIVLRYIDFWTSLIIIFLEIVIIAVGWSKKRRGLIVQANVWGKIKMCLQVAGVAFLLLAIVFDLASLIPLASGTFYLAIAFAIVSLLIYSI